MRTAVIVFPGSNCDRDLVRAFTVAFGTPPTLVWYQDTDLPPKCDVVGIPGGFSFGDYLRVGAIAAQSPIAHALVRFAQRGGWMIGICNGFQILTELELLPGTLLCNASTRFVSKWVHLRVNTVDSGFTCAYGHGQIIRVPIAHKDGQYYAPAPTIQALRDMDRIACTYVDNPNGSRGDIAGVLSENKRVLGVMPHPERCIDTAQSSTDGLPMFMGLTSVIQSDKNSAVLTPQH